MRDGRRGSGPRTVSFRVRILATVLAITAVALVSAGGVSYLLQRDRHLAEVDARLVASVGAARDVLDPTAVQEGGGVLVARAPAVQPTTTAEAVEAVLARVLAAPLQSSLGLVDGAPAYLPAARPPFELQQDAALLARVLAETADGSVRIGTAETAGGPIRYVAAPIAVEGDAATGLYLTAFDLDGELAELRASFLTYALVAAVALLAIGVVGWFLAGRLLAPIRRLRDTASRIGGAHLAERIPVTGADEVSELTATVNGMLDRIDASVTAQRRLLDDVRHELGTPITIVRGHLELLDPADPREVAEVRALALDELDRMSGLVRDIAVLSATEERPLRNRPVDVSDLARDVFQKASAIGGHEWRLGGTVDVVAMLDPERITQAWLQLCDNAAKHSPAGTPIDLGVEWTGDGVECWVQDHGPGVPPEAHERIFTRFGRVDTGRGVAGSGLGLPIVRTIARAHGGDVTLRSSPAGSRFALRLPISGTVHIDDTGPIPVVSPTRTGEEGT